ncbi:dockerin type I domain-containing protein [Faecalimicrobium sp. JNUCC 81]
MKNKNKLIKTLFTVVLTISLCFIYAPELLAKTLVSPSTNIEMAIDKTGALMYKNTHNPTVGTLSGEWTILSLARAGYKVPNSYYDKYYDNVVKTLKECDGNLHKVKYTEYSRVILGLTSIGKDVRNVGGYNLLEKLADFNKVIKQGINGPIFALIALDTNNYEIPIAKDVKVQTTREMLIDYILDREIKKGTSEAGGWALTGDIPDPDITAMALQSLAKYKNKEKVKPYIDRALNVLSNLQLETGGYSSWGTTNSESVAQVIVALTALGIDPAKDERFIKSEGKWTISSIMDFYIESGGFKHVLDKELDAMATDQGMYAIVAYDRFVKGKNKLYDMTDAKSTLNTGEIEDSKTENKEENINSPTINKNPIQSTNKPLINKDSTNKNTSKSISKNRAPAIAKVLYSGEEDNLILSGKKAVIVQFANERAIPQVVFKNNTLMYYSNELSNKYQVATYIGIFDKDEKLEELNDITKYKFNKNTTSENITFGDVNGDNIVNAQDALNTISTVLEKIDVPSNKEILSMDNNGDSKIDNLDVIGIMERYIKQKECNVLNNI